MPDKESQAIHAIGIGDIMPWVSAKLDFCTLTFRNINLLYLVSRQVSKESVSLFDSLCVEYRLKE